MGMQEGAIMEIVKWFIGILILLMLVSFTIYALNLGNINTFKQQVNYEIERHGGLTTEAQEIITDISDNLYGGRFTVESDQAGERVEYGERVDYTVKAHVNLPFFEVDIYPIEFKGTAVSYVR